jgi:dynein heavy chain
LSKFEEIAFNVESVNNRLKECLDTSKLFNSREFLTGKDQKDYSRLQQMVKDFQPYSNMWLTTKKWFSSH